MIRKLATVILAVLILAGVATPVTLVRMNLRQIAGHADVVFIGTVDRQVCEKIPSRRNLIYTKVTFRDLTVISGSIKTSTITLPFAGGKMGTESVRVPGMPTFAVGDRVLLFAGVDRPWFCPVIRMEARSWRC